MTFTLVTNAARLTVVREGGSVLLTVTDHAAGTTARVWLYPELALQLIAALAAAAGPSPREGEP